MASNDVGRIHERALEAISANSPEFLETFWKANPVLAAEAMALDASAEPVDLAATVVALRDELFAITRRLRDVESERDLLRASLKVGSQCQPAETGRMGAIAKSNTMGE